jgi:hypothetical protein
MVVVMGQPKGACHLHPVKIDRQEITSLVAVSALEQPVAGRDLLGRGSVVSPHLFI